MLNSNMSVVLQCKLVSSAGLRKRRSAPLHASYGVGRTLLYYAGYLLNVFVCRILSISRCSQRLKTSTFTLLWMQRKFLVHQQTSAFVCGFVVLWCLFAPIFHSICILSETRSFSLQ